MLRFNFHSMRRLTLICILVLSGIVFTARAACADKPYAGKRARSVKSIPVKTDLSAAGKSGRIRIAFGSCNLNPDSPVWNSISKREPDLLLFLGDNLYFDDRHFSDGRRMAAYYREIFSYPSLAGLIRKVPTFAIWDDHDYGPNDSDSTFPNAAGSLRAFRGMWPNLPQPESLAGSIAFRISLPGVKILMTDGRSFRINPGRPGQALFGDRQLEWMESELAASDAQVTIIAAGSQLLGRARDHDESLSEFPQEQFRLIEMIRNSPSKVILLSGDLHFARVMEAGIGDKIVVEATSSPLTAKPRNFKKAPESAMGRSVFPANNFGELELDLTGRLPAGYVRIYDIGGKPVIRKKLAF